MKNGVSTVTLDDLIRAALTGHTNYNQQRLGNEAARYARRVSKARAPDLPEDLHDEIGQQAFVELFNAGPDALARHGGKGLFRRAVLAAIRAVRASYAPPGQRTRASKEMQQMRVAAEDVGRVADRREVERCSVAEASGVVIDFDLFPDRKALEGFRRVEDGLDVDTVLSKAPHQVASALRLIHLDDEPVEAVAAQAAISRFALNRRFTTFYELMRAAA